MIGQTISHYKILEELGAGGMGVVYKAEDTKLKRTVALKFLPPELTRNKDAKTRFIHEAQAASALQHHNICAIHEIDETKDGRLFISMDCYEGETLKDKIARGPLPMDEAIDIASQVAAGLSEAHEAGMVHRDIKPANIMVTDKGVVKILDFGLAKLAGQTKVTKTGTTVGTVAYMSPEQATGSDIDHRSDVFSLGAVLYEMLAGELPFKGDHEAAVLYGITHNDAAPLAKHRTDVPEDLQRIVETALRKEPGERYPTALEMISDLSGLRKGASATGHAGVRVKNVRRLIIVAVSILAVIASYLAYSRLSSTGLEEAREDRKMIVVLPFENLGPQEDEYFADGVTEEITARLAGVRELGVIARTSAVQYKDADKGVEQIGEELGVEYVMEGTVRWQKGTGEQSRVRITPQLIRVADGTHVWADIYDEPLIEIFRVQTDVAERVVEALNVRLLDHERDFLASQPTSNAEALDFYMRGNEYFVRRHIEPPRRMRTAVQFYERAIGADPEFASAYAMLGWVCTELYWHADPSDELRDKATSAIETAKSLSPDALDVRLASGVFEYHFLRYDKAIEELTTVLDLYPSNAAVLAELAYAHTRKGNWDEGIELLSRALELDPRSHSVAYEMAFRYRMVRRFDDAERYCDRAIELSPGSEIAHIEKALLYIARAGDTEAARRVLDDAMQIADQSSRFRSAIEYVDLCAGEYPESPEDCFKVPPWHWHLSEPGLWGAVLEIMGESDRARDYCRIVVDIVEGEDERDWFGFHDSVLGIAYAGLGRKDEALAAGRQSVRLASRSAWKEALALQSLARIQVITGDFDEAISLLDRLLTMPGELTVHVLRLDPRWAALRGQVGFQRLLEKHSPTDS